MQQKLQSLNERLQKTSVTLTDLPPLSRCQRRQGFWVVVNQGSFGSCLAVRGGNEFRVTPNDTLWLVALWSSPAAMCPPCYTQLSLSLMSRFTHSKHHQWDRLWGSQLFLIQNKEMKPGTKGDSISMYGRPTLWDKKKAKVMA